MSAITPPRAVIDIAAGTGGLVHVSVFLAQALDQSVPTLLPRSDLYKCAGGGLPSCPTCARHLAPIAAGQQWAEPEIDAGACALFADADRYGPLYVASQTQGE
ncbi:hypothetical protein [Massilia antarctica]|uniref:hypothetical protein n=1 Tax=Massilia antarctica TaxID=2765360 RepID=UPI00226EA51E|nr:hypothetical protein [Massilia sp. H27-R4]MCY0913230.1 hypothetical protein [Massilia sp. H27-R4]